MRIFAGRHLVTASALLDLVSETWLRSLARHCRTTGAAGAVRAHLHRRIALLAAEPEDDAIRELMNRHQRSNDKGFGPAPARTRSMPRRAVFRTSATACSARRATGCCTPDARELQRQLIEGWAEAAHEMAPDQAPTIVGWRDATARARRRRPLAHHRRPRGSGGVATERPSVLRSLA